MSAVATGTETARVWRVLGDPLEIGAGAGPLAGLTVAVKDLLAVGGYAVGAGVPDFLAEAEPAINNAPAVQALLDAGADVLGITYTDQFAYSIAGTNEHYPVPPNSAVPGAVPGGSTSGSASAVGLGLADIGLGTDTAGSIRIPASYQGLWGLRTTHGVVSLEGVVPLAPSFDTVGWITRDVGTLRSLSRLERVDLPTMPFGFVVAPAVLDLLSPATRSAYVDLLDKLPGGYDIVDLPDIEEVFSAFRTAQAAEAWAAHGEWVRAHPTSLTGAVRDRFAAAAALDAVDVAEATVRLAEHRAALDAVLGEQVLVLPSAPSSAPLLAADPATVDKVRGQTLRLTCLAGTTGRPAVSAPLMYADGGPVGLSLVGPRHSDIALVDLAGRLALR